MQTSSGYVLRVERGRTRFPERPLIGDRFLIGAGSNCQLQLGGDIPLLHSIVIPEDDHFWIDAVVASPPLIVNGQAVRESALRQGDLIEIGGFVFSLDRQHRPIADAATLPPAPQSAAQLVDSMARELTQLAELDPAPASGMQALLEAALRKQSAVENPAAAQQAVLDGLQARAAALDQRETLLRQFAEQLERTQSALQQQLRAACDQIGVATDDDNAPELRLTA